MELSIDMEKVIRGLEKCKRHECDDCTEKGASQAPWDCPVYDDFVDSAIVLLKEQDELLKHEYWRGYNNGRADERGLQEGTIMQTFDPD
jgi:hypothetical protein